MSTFTKTPFLAGTLSNVKRLFAPSDPVEMGPFVRNMKTTARGSAIVRPDLRDLCANVRFVRQTRAGTGVHASEVIRGLDSYAYVPWVVEGLFVKKVRFFFTYFDLIHFFQVFCVHSWVRKYKK